MSWMTILMQALISKGPLSFCKQTVPLPDRHYFAVRPLDKNGGKPFMYYLLALV